MSNKTTDQVLDQKEAEHAIRNYTRVPNMLVDGYDELHPQDKWLFVCLDRLCGKEKNRYLSLRYISKRTGFTPSVLSDNKKDGRPGMIQRLHNAGLIHAEIKRKVARDGEKQAQYHITITDTWALNYDFYNKECSESEHLDSKGVLIPNTGVLIPNANSKRCSDSEHWCSDSGTIVRLHSKITDSNKITKQESNATTVSTIPTQSANAATMQTLSSLAEKLSSEELDQLLDQLQAQKQHLSPGKETPPPAQETSLNSSVQDQGQATSDKEKHGPATSSDATVPDKNRQARTSKQESDATASTPTEKQPARTAPGAKIKPKEPAEPQGKPVLSERARTVYAAWCKAPWFRGVAPKLTPIAAEHCTTLAACDPLPTTEDMINTRHWHIKKYPDRKGFELGNFVSSYPQYLSDQYKPAPESKPASPQPIKIDPKVLERRKIAERFGMRSSAPVVTMKGENGGTTTPLQH